jgi:hypothetical protein
MCLVLIVTVVNMFGLAYDGLSNSMADLPKGELVASIPSTDKKHTLNLYKASLTGVGHAVRGEIVDAKNQEVKNIYWQLDTKIAEAFWVNKSAVNINGNVVNINGEPYDSRKVIELPDASLKNLMQQAS